MWRIDQYLWQEVNALSCRDCFRIEEDGTYLFGRGAECAVRIDDMRVSRCHARIVVEGKTMEIADEGSSNGTFVNGRRLAAGSRRRLEANYQFSLGATGVGSVLFCVRGADDAPSDDAPSEGKTVRVHEPTRNRIEIRTLRVGDQGQVNIAGNDISPMRLPHPPNIPEIPEQPRPGAPGNALSSENIRKLKEDQIQKIQDYVNALDPYPHIVGTQVRQGGMGAIFFYSDKSNSGLPLAGGLRLLAAKKPADPGNYSQHLALIREAEFLSRLKHPHLAQYAGLGRHEGAPVMLLRLVPGPSLEDRARECSVPDSTRHVWEAADALRYMHSQGVCHRDAKPANILLDWDRQAQLWSAVLIDLGVAHQDEGTLTATGQAAGTLLYSSPRMHALLAGIRLGDEPEEKAEKRAFRLNVYRATDAYALGAVLCFCLTGETPCQAAHRASAVEAHKAEHVPDVYLEAKPEDRAGMRERWLSALDEELEEAKRTKLEKAEIRKPEDAGFANLTKAESEELRKARIDPYLQRVCREQADPEDATRPSVDVFCRRLGLWLLLQEAEKPVSDGEWRDLAGKILAGASFSLSGLGAEWKERIGRTALRSRFVPAECEIRHYREMTAAEQNRPCVLRLPVPGPERLKNWLLEEIDPEVTWNGGLLLAARAVVCGGEKGIAGKEDAVSTEWARCAQAFSPLLGEPESAAAALPGSEKAFRELAGAAESVPAAVLSWQAARIASCGLNAVSEAREASARLSSLQERLTEIGKFLPKDE